MKRLLSSFTAIGLALLISSQAFAQDPKFVSVEVQPKAIELKNPYEYRQLLITGIAENGDRIDLTRQAKFQAPGFVKVSPAGQVRSSADGTGELRFTVAGQSGAIPAHVSGQKDDYEIS